MYLPLIVPLIEFWNSVFIKRAVRGQMQARTVTGIVTSINHITRAGDSCNIAAQII